MLMKISVKISLFFKIGLFKSKRQIYKKFSYLKIFAKKLLIFLSFLLQKYFKRSWISSGFSV